MYCRNCGEELNETQAICLKCGVKVGDGNQFCYNCGKATNENAVACLNCGVSLEKEKKSFDGKIGDQDKVLIALLCFFLGALGIHNFVLGENKKGICKIIATCCCGVGFILALVDLVKILTDSYEVDPTAIF